MNKQLRYEELLEKCHWLEEEVENQRRIVAKLKERDDRFRDIANNALEWIWEIDKTGKYTFSSPVVKKILGYEPEEVIGKYFYDFFHPDEKDELARTALKAFANKSSFRQFVNRNVCKDGNEVILSTSGVPILSEDGSLIGYRGADTDITEKYVAEKRLQVKEDLLQSLLISVSGFAIYRLIYDQKAPHLLRVLFVSPSIEELLGIPEPMKFETWFDFIHPDDVDRMTTANRKAFETLRFDEAYRTYHPKKEEWRWIHAISTGSANAEGNIMYVNGIMIDITDKQNAYEELKTRERELDEKTKDLKQMNAALNVLLKKREQDRLNFEERITANLKQLVLPYLEKIKTQKPEHERQAILDIIETNLKEITSNFTHRLSSKYIGLTPKEIKIADMVRQGQKTKQIAKVLFLSQKTVETHRENIRKKLNINNKKINLQSYLASMK